jgi:thiol-disulfide isomerase/thioredoxin
LRVLLEARQWLNTPPLGVDALRGRVVVVNFWTYSCINCLRTLPYLRAWSARYRDRGLVVVGVHTPEFAFERDVANVSRATAALDVGYPVVIDSDFAIWRAFHNDAWPAFYFIGTDGRVHDRVRGEGDYDQAERLIQRLLSEADGMPPPGESATVDGVGAQAAPDVDDLRSPETYLGTAQATGFASPGGAEEDVPRLYRSIAALPLNRWGLAGVWTIGREFAASNDAPGSITYRFHARDLHLVMAPPSSGRAVRFRVTIDGAPPGADHGFDVDAEGWGRVQDARLYQLVRQSGPVVDRTFMIEFFDAGVRAYSFTFG